MRALNEKNRIYTGSDDKSSLYDLEIPSNWNSKLVIFVHGFMGFKDWGAWNLVQKYFVDHGYGFLKYNASHNGGTVDNPIDFPDPDAFSNNTYTKELTDLEKIISLSRKITGPEAKIYLIGHSRGGGITLLESMNQLVSGIAAWAPISTIKKRFPDLENWMKNGVRYQKNSRTHQELPMKINIYNDYISNKDRLSIEQYCSNSIVPTILIHGTEDTSVSPNESIEIGSWLNTTPILIEGAQHTFNSSHPWNSDALPDALLTACEKTRLFFDEN